MERAFGGEWIHVGMAQSLWCPPETNTVLLIGYTPTGLPSDTQSVKNLPAMQETWVRFLGQEDPLEMEMATHSSMLAWRIPWTEEPGGLQSMGSQESDMT